MKMLMKLWRELVVRMPDIVDWMLDFICAFFLGFFGAAVLLGLLFVFHYPLYDIAGIKGVISWTVFIVFACYAVRRVG